MAWYRNKKTKCIWNITDKAILKRVEKSEDYEKTQAPKTPKADLDTDDDAKQPDSTGGAEK